MIDSETTVAQNNSHFGYLGWILRVISVVACVAVATVVVSLTLGPPFARAWAQWVARHLCGDFETGVVVGFVTGLLGAAVTLFAALMSSLAWRRRGGPALSLGVGAIAMLAVIPGAVNLSIAVGAAGSGVRAAGRILDVDGPAFRGAWIAGSVAGLLLYMAAALLLGRSLRSTFGPVRQVAAPLPGVVGYTADGRPVFAQVGFTSDGIPVLADQLEARYPARPAVGTNALAIVALVLGIFGGVLAIPVGHVSLNQIRRSGESGRGLAVAGLVLGYLSLVVVVGVVFVAVSAAYR
ncbi:DUF4190 domain-containing protein [Rhodococcus erythropolis]|uniref:DUF4190 domain-containing protein n=1 Tax=Rhodococcus TaxID=1827 RepID=UPI001245749D|nr:MULTISPECIES: DUF4190 domain-containing protein [Rhodococcus]MCJ0948148.1 DUF4190 domain-containing protein [Rhodococcus sp. ARC_M8]QEX13563.1 DUF4190 domain-containing protein [Rhodococcus erythropolis]ULD43107.1 DUF4190 domain-containing protein [Rhodococcus qingshengii]